MTPGCWSILFLSSCLFLSLFTAFCTVWTIEGKGHRDCSSHKTVYFFFFLHLIKNENISNNLQKQNTEFPLSRGKQLVLIHFKIYENCQYFEGGRKRSWEEEREEVSLLYSKAFWLKILYHQAPLDQSEWKMLRSLYLTLWGLNS